jgi:superfamily II DNA or RNA helicase
MGITLRDYQMDLYSKAIEEFKAGKKRVLISAPCGSGKSYLFLKMCESAKSRNKKILILVHRKELAEQHKDLFAEHGLDIPQIRVALFFSEINRLGQYDKPDLIICDECHWIPKTLRKVLDYYDCRVIGLTATPCRLSGASMGDVYETLITGISVKELIVQKCLAPYEYYSVPVADTTELPIQHGEYVMASAEQLLMQTAIYGDVIKSYQRFAEGARTIVYATSIKHSKSVVQAFCDAGYKAAHIDGSMSKAERQQIMNDFRSGKITIISNVMLIIEGISIPDCECCILLRPTVSTTIYIQSAMRCMRYKEGKTAKIIDCVMNYSKMGFPDDDREWSLEKKITPRKEFNEDGTLSIRQCEMCFRCYQGSKCPYCGAEHIPKGRELRQIQEVELKKIEAIEKEELEKKKKDARMEVGRCKTIADLQKIARERGYAQGWIWQMARIKHIGR